MILIKFLLFLITLGSAMAAEFRYLARSPRGLLMGDAYTTLADDEFTLFYNPATLGRNLGVDINLLNPTVGANNVVRDADTFDNFPDSDAAAIADRVLGFPLHFRTGATPYIKVGRLGLSFLADLSVGMELNNKVHPVLDIDYRYDRGFVVGYAYTWGKKNKTKKKGRKIKNQGGKSNSVGVGIKYLRRQGIRRTFHLFGTETLNIVNNSSNTVDDLKENLGFADGSSWGLDIGYEKTITTGSSTYRIGASILDVGGTHFSNRSVSGTIPDQDMFVNAGFSMNQDFGLFDYTLAFDLHPLNIAAPFLRKVHVGAELNFPLFSVLLGWNGGYRSYGVEVDLWAVRLTAGFYSVEAGETYRQLESSRMLLYLNLLNVSFDDLGIKNL